MTSKQVVQPTSASSTAVAPPQTVAIKDSPAVERALNRSKIYLLVLMEPLVSGGRRVS